MCLLFRIRSQPTILKSTQVTNSVFTTQLFNIEYTYRTCFCSLAAMYALLLGNAIQIIRISKNPHLSDFFLHFEVWIFYIFIDAVLTAKHVGIVC